MTTLSARKTRLTFETDNFVRGRALIVEPQPLYCSIRLKGTRKRYDINWETIYVHAAQIAGDRLRAERRANRAARRFGKGREHDCGGLSKGMTEGGGSCYRTPCRLVAVTLHGT